MTRTRESHQTHKSTTETQLISLRRELSQAQLELSTRSLQDDRADVESQREHILEEIRFVAALENELDSFEVCVQIEAEQYLEEKYTAEEESIRASTSRVELKAEAEISNKAVTEEEIICQEVLSEFHREEWEVQQLRTSLATINQEMSAQASTAGPQQASALRNSSNRWDRLKRLERQPTAQFDTGEAVRRAEQILRN